MPERRFGNSDGRMRIFSVGARLRLVVFILATLGVAGCMPPAAGLAVDAVYTASEERDIDEVVDDNKIKIALNRYLLEEDVELFKDVSTVVYRGRVLLLGTVAAAEAKERAAQLATKPDGVREVINEIQVTDEGGVVGFVKDVVIEKQLQVAYLFDEEIDSANYRVRSVNGVVYLIGGARSPAELDKVINLARETEAVREVVSYVTIVPSSSEPSP